MIDKASLRKHLPLPAPKTKVSVLCCTYNHERFIRESLEGIVSQETDFDFEIIVADDASTDHTQDIIREFAERYPDQFRLVLRTENVGIGENYYQALSMVEGEYLAICDGDDVWVDTQKLQKQVDFLDAKTDYMVICTSFQRREFRENQPCEDSVFYVNDYIQSVDKVKEYYSFADLLNCRFVGSCTVMLRWQFGGGCVPDFIRYYNTIDFPLTILHSACGKIGVLNNEITARYSVHNASISFQKGYKAANETVSILNEIEQFL